MSLFIVGIVISVVAYCVGRDNPYYGSIVLSSYLIGAGMGILSVSCS